jgi:hypothetical protein
MAYDTSEDRWRIEKRISVGDIIKTLLVAAGVVLYVGEIEKAVLRNEGQIGKIDSRLQAETQARQAADEMIIDRLGRTEGRIDQTLQQIRDSLQRIESRLDGKADK